MKSAFNLDIGLLPSNGNHNQNNTVHLDSFAGCLPLEQEPSPLERGRGITNRKGESRKRWHGHGRKPSWRVNGWSQDRGRTRGHCHRLAALGAIAGNAAAGATTAIQVIVTGGAVTWSSPSSALAPPKSSSLLLPEPPLPLELLCSPLGLVISSCLN
ncbi:hypothetical protein SKAU_G00009100 [Synaphobranchus kaupii]|uniref:Uncharacterized protein n=1 Tax=Synaphobranchus kaupii TaxID=118154 RepID=A0A9Q1GBH6_SYNKA|nr:hypothetical protein SKAU_G00009100 [Synaphobranchus kaupii]